MVVARATLLTAAALIWVTLGATGANAADEKPAFTIKTRSIEASLIIADDLRTFPGLFEDLLPEGRREIAKWQRTADTDRKNTPDIFQDGRRYTYERAYTQRSAIGHYVSVLRSDHFETGGAHPNSTVNTILWDTTTKKRISIRLLFKETADNGPTLQRLAKVIRNALATEKKKRDMPVVDPDQDIGLSAVEPTLFKIGAVALAPSTEAGKSAGLVFYFSPYAVGGYVEGSYTAYIPASEFRDDLSAQGAALFGGERPKADAEKD
jgi:hypothetical protein